MVLGEKVIRFLTVIWNRIVIRDQRFDPGNKSLILERSKFRKELGQYFDFFFN